MEPADLNSPSAPDDAALEARLRQPLAPLPDAGFSQRVLAALPPPVPAAAPARAHARWPRAAICLLGALVGFLIARRGETEFSATEMSAQLQSSLAPLGAALADPKMLLSLVLTVVVVLYALRPGPLPRSRR